jgi:DAACS family dicarboxylate/amino acid:cation (Na+ or H+) symporter
MTLTGKIIAAMAAGIAVGVVLNLVGDALGPVTGFLVDGVLLVIGRLFVAALQMMVVPLVLTSLVCGVISMSDVRALGRLGIKTFALYLATTAVALVIALSLATAISPGEGFELGTDAAYEPRPAPPLTQVLIDLIPTNPIQALAAGEMLQIIVFAILLGFAMNLAGAAGQRVGRVVVDLNEIIIKMVLLVIRTAPLGVFALLTQTFATQGFGALSQLAGYAFAVVLALVLHVAITYTTLLKLSGLSIRRFFAKMRTPMTFAFSTSSSSATIPVTLETVEHKLGVRNSIASFTIPLGATINMDGTAIMQGVATVFIANAYGIDLSIADFLTVILTATLASIGTAAVPSAGLVMLAIVLQQVGLPVEGIGIILGIDRLLDMLRTAVNITGDATVTCVVARTEQALHQATFDDPLAAKA